MRVAYYTHPAFFEVALSAVRELSRHAQVDLLLEISGRGWQSAAFELPPRSLPAGILEADPILSPELPAGVREYWRAASSFHLVVHRSRRSLHPASWALSRRVLAFAASRGADVLHVDDVDVSPRLSLGLAGGTRLPTVIAVHDPEPHSGERNWRRALARRLAYPAAQRFVLFNHASRDPFVARYRVPASAVDDTRLGPYHVFREWPAAATSTRPSVLFFGRLSPYKGLDTLYAAMPLIAARVPNVKLTVAGRAIDGYLPPRPPRLDGGATIETIERYIPNQEAAQMFGTSTVVVCPYRDATQSGVALTAFAFRVPVVATTVGGLPEYVMPERTGLLVPPDDPAALADATARLLLDHDLRSRIQRGIDDAALAELNWRRTIDALLSTYIAAKTR